MNTCACPTCTCACQTACLCPFSWDSEPYLQNFSTHVSTSVPHQLGLLLAAALFLSTRLCICSLYLHAILLFGHTHITPSASSRSPCMYSPQHTRMHTVSGIAFYACARALRYTGFALFLPWFITPSVSSDSVPFGSACTVYAERWPLLPVADARCILRVPCDFTCTRTVTCTRRVCVLFCGLRCWYTCIPFIHSCYHLDVRVALT